ncbi:MAG: hypothetical protein K2L54_04100, partial [Clostridiales bacterium]|nr:hypothetical protein [Clostridiales bacterium]
MKSKFAKFIDGTVGACLIFLAATAVMRYYTTLELAVFSAAAITACACFLFKLFGKKKESAVRLSAAADGMFFDFMFSDDAAPVKLLYAGLKSKTPDVKLRGKGVYLNGTAAFCFFNAPPDKKSIARCIAKAKHFGATKTVILSKLPPQSTVDVDGMMVKLAHGDDIYKLFGSLGALPQKKYEQKRKSRRAAFFGAFGKDKIMRYVILSCSLFAVSALNGYSVITLVCACACAALAVASVAVSVSKAIK